MGRCTYSLTVPGRVESLPQIMAFLADRAREWDLETGETYEIELVVEEACMNIIHHGYSEAIQGEIHLVCQLKGQEMTFILEDDAPPFDPSQVPEPDVEAPLEERTLGGLGIFFMRRIMDKVQFEQLKPRGNRLTLVKHRTFPASADPPV
ncbi:MAG: ATP-binding protein [Chloroflexi bacterium]|nr:ATP-binding protein [Chloroflexota bacterium]